MEKSRESECLSRGRFSKGEESEEEALAVQADLELLWSKCFNDLEPPALLVELEGDATALAVEAAWL